MENRIMKVAEPSDFPKTGLLMSEEYGNFWFEWITKTPDARLRPIPQESVRVEGYLNDDSFQANHLVIYSDSEIQVGDPFMHWRCLEEEFEYRNEIVKDTNLFITEDRNILMKWIRLINTAEVSEYENSNCEIIFR